MKQSVYNLNYVNYKLLHVLIDIMLMQILNSNALIHIVAKIVNISSRNNMEKTNV